MGVWARGLALARPPHCRDNAPARFRRRVAESRLASPLGSERLTTLQNALRVLLVFARSLTPGGPELRGMAALPLSLTNLHNERLRMDRGSHCDDQILGPWKSRLPSG
jgi:hypothetical protein